MRFLAFVAAAVLAFAVLVGLGVLAHTAAGFDVPWVVLVIGFIGMVCALAHHLTEYGPRGFVYMLTGRGAKPSRRPDVEVFRN